MIKRVVVALLVLILAVAAGSVVGCGSGVPGDAVAKVGNVTIMKSDFDQRLQELAAQYGVPSEQENPEQWAEFKVQALDYMVMYQMVAQKAESLGVSVTDEEIAKQIDEVLQAQYQGDQAAMEKDLADRGMTLDAIKTTMREYALLQKVYEKVTESVTEVPEADIQKYYDENKTYFAQDETRVARHILIKPGGPAINPPTTTTTTAPAGSESTPTTQASTTTTAAPVQADWDAALATAQSVRSQLEAGGDWTKLASDYSDDPGSCTNGGDLGTVQKGVMVPEFEDSVFSLKENEISQPVKTTYGYHIIQVTKINAAKQFALDEVKDQIKTQLVNQAKEKTWTEWLEATKAELGVTYQEGYGPATTATTAGETDTTSGAADTTVPAETTATTAGETITTVKP